MGKWIIVSFVLFGGFIGTLVTICIRENVDLVSRNYYQDELNYGEQIERINNTAALISKPAIKVDGRLVTIDFNQRDSVVGAQLTLFCPSNPALDRKFQLRNDRQFTQHVELEPSQKGMFRARLFWTMNGKDFYHEQIIFI